MIEEHPRRTAWSREDRTEVPWPFHRRRIAAGRRRFAGLQSRNPRIYMKPGASLTTRIEGHGSITNKIVDSTKRK